jgi:hypothetical protein
VRYAEETPANHCASGAQRFEQLDASSTSSETIIHDSCLALGLQSIEEFAPRSGMTIRLEAGLSRSMSNFRGGLTIEAEASGRRLLSHRR